MRLVEGAWITVAAAQGSPHDFPKAPAPFLRADGSPYIEVHDVRTLAENGPDTIDNAVALCPTCHRLLHHAGASDRGAAVSKLRERVTRLTPVPV